MISIVTWLWEAPVGYRSKFTTEHVNVLFRMVDRHYRKPHRNIVVTDITQGLDRSIEVVRGWNDYAGVANPNGMHNPSCYRRLRAFAPDAGAVLGDRVVSMDLDTVIVGDITPIVERREDFIIWGESDFPRKQWYNGSLWNLKTGTRTKVWEQFNPRFSPRHAAMAGHRGSDQGWLSCVLGPGEKTYSKADGVYSFRKDIAPSDGALPADARLVAFHGHTDPWSYRAQHYDWVRAAWR